jgi:subtilisin-like proprotein convertase family protein
VKKIQGSHTFFKDLEVRLIGPSGTNVLLWKDKCASNVSFNVGMDDSAAAGPFGCPPPNTGVAFKPAEPLSAFNGQSSAGVWTLRVKDNVHQAPAVRLRRLNWKFVPVWRSIRHSLRPTAH